jgi:hypothetical protein
MSTGPVAPLAEQPSLHDPEVQMAHNYVATASLLATSSCSPPAHGLAAWFPNCGRARPFMDYDLGYFDDERCRLEPIENPFGPKVLPMPRNNL